MINTAIFSSDFSTPQLTINPLIRDYIMKNDLKILYNRFLVIDRSAPAVRRQEEETNEFGEYSETEEENRSCSFKVSRSQGISLENTI